MPFLTVLNPVRAAKAAPTGPLTFVQAVGAVASGGSITLAPVSPHTGNLALVVVTAEAPEVPSMTGWTTIYDQEGPDCCGAPSGNGYFIFTKVLVGGDSFVVNGAASIPDSAVYLEWSGQHATPAAGDVIGTISLPATAATNTVSTTSGDTLAIVVDPGAFNGVGTAAAVTNGTGLGAVTNRFAGAQRRLSAFTAAAAAATAKFGCSCTIGTAGQQCAFALVVQVH